MAVDIDGIEAGDEVNEDIVNTLRDFLQERSSNLLIGGVLGKVDGNQELLSLSIDITNINTTLVGEEDPVALCTTISQLSNDIIPGRRKGALD